VNFFHVTPGLNITIKAKKEMFRVMDMSRDVEGFIASKFQSNI